ncbi:MAG TPA: TIGR01777 family oxidoreductase [Armatimonadota bacterium]|nr:TIGR01777 family oxidoreductase [Armatimonadota bacterium]
MRIVLPGGSGQVGTVVARHFHAAGHEVVALARSPIRAPWKTVQWDGATVGDWAAEIDGVDIVINLAGRNVNCRYNATNRREIKESRVHTTKLVGQAIAQAARPPEIWMNASTATIYRHTFERAMDEATGELGGGEPDAPDAWRFSIEVAKSWEEAFFSSPAPATRKIALRSAMIMSPDRGGIFDTLLGLVRRGLGGTAGSGRQFVSWVHEQDFLRALEYFIDHADIEGIVNAASPNPLPNKEFMSDLREAWGTKVGLPAAAWMLKIGAVFLRTETELILKSRRVVPGRLAACGFQFEFPEWAVAAHDLIERWRKQA